MTGTPHTRPTRRRMLAVAAAFIAANGVALGATGTSVSALTEYTVTTIDDEFDPGATVATPGGTGLSLREAIALANGDADDSVINLASDATYQLDLCVQENAIIDGDDLDHVPDGAESLTINGNGSTIEQTCDSRVLRHDGGGMLTLDDVTITGGTTEGTGGGVSSYGPATLQNGSQIIGNRAWAGGGIHVSGALMVTGGSAISNNTAIGSGGGVHSIAELNGNAQLIEVLPLPPVVMVTGSTIDGNCAGARTDEGDAVLGCDAKSASGGGIYSQGRVIVTDSAITNNTASGSGGGIFQGGGYYLLPLVQTFRAPRGIDEEVPSVVVTNSTVSSNTAATGDVIDRAAIENLFLPGGGGIATTAKLELTNATIAANSSASNGANVQASSLDSFGSVIAYPGDSANCWTNSTVDMGYNYSDDATCAFAGTGSTNSGSDPSLGPLALNGGTTENHLPDLDSNLVDAIPLASCSVGPDDDQRGIERPQGFGCDIGAVEVVNQVIKVDIVVDNGDGGTATGADFTIEVYDVGGSLVASGVDPEPGTGNASAEFILPTGDYTFGVSGPAGYEGSVSIVVTAPTEAFDDPSADFSVVAGETVEAVITVDDIPPPTTTTTTTTTVPIPSILPATGTSGGTGVLALIAGLLVLLGTGAAYATRRR